MQRGSIRKWLWGLDDQSLWSPEGSSSALEGNVEKKYSYFEWNLCRGEARRALLYGRGNSQFAAGDFTLSWIAALNKMEFHWKEKIVSLLFRFLLPLLSAQYAFDILRLNGRKMCHYPIDATTTTCVSEILYVILLYVVQYTFQHYVF